ncbi:Uncharacterised protein [Leminorella richardii]|uniref:Uncharacterized protein n=1 Tax=Leminorella richardii TaxID=158841 RepID=A0A2X4UM60_9GAMM|nr:Uncharacterised protein [Leminorella richardii]
MLFTVDSAVNAQYDNRPSGAIYAQYIEYS